MIDEPGSHTRDFGDNYDDFHKTVTWTVLLSGGGEWFITTRDESLETSANLTSSGATPDAPSASARITYPSIR